MTLAALRDAIMPPLQLDDMPPPELFSRSVRQH
jgi:hypothetical protein